MDILFVDDSDADRLLYEESIEDNHDNFDQVLKVDYAENAEHALTLMAEKTYQVIFLDIRMPGIDGFHLLDKIRHQYSMTYPVIYMLSSSNHYDDIDFAYKKLANGYFVKPDSYKALCEFIYQSLVLVDKLELPESNQRRLN